MENQAEITPFRLALHDLHADAGASFIESDGWLLPAYYTDPSKENLAVRNRAGIADLSYKGYLRISGPDRASFLQGIITNDVSNLKPGDGLHSAILTIKGRIIADFCLLCFEDYFLLETEPAATDKLHTTLAKYKIREKVTIESAKNLATVAVQGPASGELVTEMLGTSTPELQTYQHFSYHTGKGQLTIRRQSLTGDVGYILTMPHETLAAMWRSLLQFRDASAEPIGFRALESLRIETGIPRYGPDLTEDIIPLEINDQDMISFTKGCYVGQEVMSRLKFLGQANKHLKGLHVMAEALPKHGDEITIDGREVGRVTSSAYSPTLKRPIALAYIRREYSSPNTQVTIQIDGLKTQGIVTDLPFIK